MKPKAIIFDLDGTLCDLSESINPYNHDGEEIIIPEMNIIFSCIQYFEKNNVIILTGRKRKEYGKITEKWLIDNGIYYDELIMQEKSQADKNHVFKREKLIELKENYDIVAMFDDNEEMIPVCKELGILLLHVNR